MSLMVVLRHELPMKLFWDQKTFIAHQFHYRISFPTRCISSLEQTQHTRNHFLTFPTISKSKWIRFIGSVSLKSVLFAFQCKCLFKELRLKFQTLFECIRFRLKLIRLRKCQQIAPNLMASTKSSWNAKKTNLMNKQLLSCIILSLAQADMHGVAM